MPTTHPPLTQTQITNQITGQLILHTTITHNHSSRTTGLILNDKHNHATHLHITTQRNPQEPLPIIYELTQTDQININRFGRVGTPEYTNEHILKIQQNNPHHHTIETTHHHLTITANYHYDQRTLTHIDHTQKPTIPTKYLIPEHQIIHNWIQQNHPLQHHHTTLTNNHNPRITYRPTNPSPHHGYIVITYHPTYLNLHNKRTLEGPKPTKNKTTHHLANPHFLQTLQTTLTKILQ